MDGEYAEVYAGGAAVALSLLFGEYVRAIHINDIDPGVYAFWVAARDHTRELCAMVQGATLDPAEWERQREIQRSDCRDPLVLGFSTFYLNRTNRSGIITGGPIGGRNQSGAWKIDARFQKEELVRRIQRIGRWRSRIHLYNLDAAKFLTGLAPGLPESTLLYLDPPYYVKGQEELYANYYGPDDHADIAHLLTDTRHPWVVTYDDNTAIRELYAQYRSTAYRIAYSANGTYRGREVMFYSADLDLPAIEDPTRVTVRGAGEVPVGHDH